MRSIFAKLALSAAFCGFAATQAQAATVYYTSNYDSLNQGWVLKWDNLSADCYNDFSQAISQKEWVITVSGVPQAPARALLSHHLIPPYWNSVNIPGPSGTLDAAAMVDGTISIVCGTDTLVIGTAPAVSAPTPTVPTLTEWGMMAMGSLIVGFGVLRLRRRERSTSV